MAHSKTEDRSCQCNLCRLACQNRPGFPTPQEAQKAIDAGLAGRYMKDWYEEDNRNIYMLAPAIRGREGKIAPMWPVGTCNFLKDGNCEIHFSGFKPQQCRQAYPCKPKSEKGYFENSDMAKLWDSEEGKLVIINWLEAIIKLKGPHDKSSKKA